VEGIPADTRRANGVFTGKIEGMEQFRLFGEIPKIHAHQHSVLRAARQAENNLVCRDAHAQQIFCYNSSCVFLGQNLCKAVIKVLAQSPRFVAA
jgi:hypothetical protein